jgi:hypothetical protein
MITTCVIIPSGLTQTLKQMSQSKTNSYIASGIPPPSNGDGHLHGTDHSVALYMAPQVVHLHIRESDHSKITIWHEGQ